MVSARVLYKREQRRYSWGHAWRALGFSNGEPLIATEKSFLSPKGNQKESAPRSMVMFEDARFDFHAVAFLLAFDELALITLLMYIRTSSCFFVVWFFILSSLYNSSSHWFSGSTLSEFGNFSKVTLRYPVR